MVIISISHNFPHGDSCLEHVLLFHQVLLPLCSFPGAAITDCLKHSSVNQQKCFLSLFCMSSWAQIKGSAGLCSLLRLCRRIHPSPHLDAGGVWYFLVCNHVIPVSASVGRWCCGLDVYVPPNSSVAILALTTNMEAGPSGDCN